MFRVKLESHRDTLQKRRPVFSHQRVWGKEVPPPPALNLAVFLVARQKYLHISQVAQEAPVKQGEESINWVVDMDPSSGSLRLSRSLFPGRGASQSSFSVEGQCEPWQQVSSLGRTEGLDSSDRNLSFPQTPLIRFWRPSQLSWGVFHANLPNTSWGDFHASLPTQQENPEWQGPVLSLFYNLEAWAEFPRVPSVITTHSLWPLYGQGFKTSMVLLSVYGSFPHTLPSLSPEKVEGLHP